MDGTTITTSVVIIGAGPAGLTAAARLYDFGVDVTLIEKQNEIGGHPTQYHRLFPDFASSSDVICALADGISGVRLLTGTQVTAIDGNAPSFRVTTSDGLRIQAEAILVSTGFNHFDATLKEEYGYGIYDNCITSIGLDAMLKQGKIKTASGSEPKKIAIVHCVGSRDELVGNNFCSRVCCTNAVKQAIEIRQLLPDAHVISLYMDIRVFGRGYEEMYRTAQEDYGVQFLRGRLSEAAEENDGRLMLRFEDTLTARPMRMSVDLLVLAVGMQGNLELADVAGLAVGCDHFYSTADPQLGTNRSQREGIFLAGTATGPKAIMESITDGRAAASEIGAYLHHAGLGVAPALAARNGSQESEIKGVR